jgi:hypothetical protein
MAQVLFHPCLPMPPYKLQAIFWVSIFHIYISLLHRESLGRLWSAAINLSSKPYAAIADPPPSATARSSLTGELRHQERHVESRGRRMWIHQCSPPSLYSGHQSRRTSPREPTRWYWGSSRSPSPVNLWSGVRRGPRPCWRNKQPSSSRLISKLRRLHEARDITIDLLPVRASLVELQRSCPVRCCRSLFHPIPSV